MSQVAITVDCEFPDRPADDPLNVLDQLADILDAEQVLATFFVVGSWATAYPGRVRAIDSAGHLVGNHGYSHCNLEKMTHDGVVADLTECRRAVAEIGIETQPWFRAPYGGMGAPDGPIYQAVHDAGYCHVTWHAHGGDWDPDRTIDEVVAQTVANVRDRWPDPAIVLFHSWPNLAAKALSRTLTLLRSEGAEFVIVSRLYV